MKIFKHFLSAQFLRFLVAGGLAALANWLSGMLFQHWFSFVWSIVLAYVVGMTAGFLLNRTLVFPYASTPLSSQIRGFILVNLGWFPVVWLASIGLNQLLMQWLTSNLSHPISHGLAIIIPTFFSFLIYKFVTFKGTSNE
jgi:putative flippase GtrA